MVRVIKLNAENKIIEVKYLKDGYALQEGESFTEAGELGYTKDGKSFIAPEEIISEHQPSQLDLIEAKIDSLLANKTQ